MRPTDSAYDRGIDQSETRARRVMDPDTAKAGDTIDYEVAEQETDDAGWSWLRQRLVRRGLCLIDTGDAWVVSTTEEN